jgi:ATP-binding cassette, subfamily B, bacterial HlyB/CyaB
VISSSSTASSATPSAPPPEDPASSGVRATGAASNPSLRALCTAAGLHQVAASPEALAHRLATGSNDTVTAADLVRAARELGLSAKAVRTTAERLPMTPLPALAMLRQPDGSEEAVVLAQCDGQRVLFQAATSTIEPVETFVAKWTGELVLLTSRASLTAALAKFDFSWFIPSLVKYRWLLGEVLLVSFMLQLFALVSPLFFQVVMDKVLVHRGTTTLDVLVIGLVIVVLFESVLSALRAFVFSHTTSRIDVELGARRFRHLDQLPLSRR